MNKKMKLSLIGSLIVGSSLTTILPIVSCSASSDDQAPINLIVNDNNLATASLIANDFLKNELVFAKTAQAQKNIVSQWRLNVNLPQNYIDAIIKPFDFKTSNGKTISGADAIERVVFNSITEIPNSGIIVGPELKVILKDKYTSEKDILIKVGDLGGVLSDLILTFGEEQASIWARLNLSVGLQNASDINQGGSRNKQQEMLDSWQIGSQVEEYHDQSLDHAIGRLLFDLDGVVLDGSQVIESITFNSKTTLPPTGEFIVGPQLKFNFKPEYSWTQDLVIEVSNLTVKAL
ncbi:MAG: hypothetical protein ACRCUM_01630 [Mycoplasmoidaceae bacterium]